MNEGALRMIEYCKRTKSKRLDLSELKLKEIPQQVKDLYWIESLYLSHNQISKIEGLEKLINLNVLWLNYNQINKIEGLEKLSHLNVLRLNSNQISKIEGLEKLINLNILDLKKNKIKDISNSLEYFKTTPLAIVWKEYFYDYQDKGINIYNNPIENLPVEIIKQGKQSILDWIASNKKALNEIKVILVGEPKAGKTSILRRLKHKEFNPDEKQTDGINIETITFSESAYFKNQPSLEGITAYFWDFGGQEIMSATHQFFLTKRAVYVLVLDARMDKDSSANIRKWIQQIVVLALKMSQIYRRNFHKSNIF